MASPFQTSTDGVRVRLKVIPGAKREGLAGCLGDRLKVRVAAPAEAGRANQAVCQVVATALHVRTAQVTIISGHASPEKILLVTGLPLPEVCARLGTT